MRVDDVEPDGIRPDGGRPDRPGIRQPVSSRPERLRQIAADEGITHFGVSAKYVDAVRNAGYLPRSRQRPVGNADDHVDRIAAVRRGLRVHL